MKPLLVFVAAVGLLLPALAAEQEHFWEKGKVIDQRLSSTGAGAVAAPLGAGVIAVPLYRQANDVVIETSPLRYHWREVGKKMHGDRGYLPPKHQLILIVNSIIQFYRDGDLFVVMDSQNKPHRFEVMGMTALPVVVGSPSQ